MEFEYDKKKSKANKIKHGVDFEEAQIIWFKDNVVVRALTKGEPRFMIIGLIRINQGLYSCIFTVRSSKIRIISCRTSHEKERKIYHERIK